MLLRISFLILFTASFFVAIPLIYAQDLLDGVVSYWSFDAGTIAGGTVEDLLGDNDGELDGNPKAVAGKIGDALEFNGENFVHIPGTGSLEFAGEDEMSVVAWVNPDSDSPVKGVVAGCCGTIVAQRDINGWALRFDGRNAGQEMEFIVQPGWQGDGGFGAPKFAKGTWHHLVGVVADDEMFLYVDGVLEKEMTYNGPMATGGSETEIGHAGDGGFVGIIDEVLIYNRAISADEVEQIFESKDLLSVQPQGKLTTRWGQIKSAF